MTTHTPGPWSLNDNTGRLTGQNKKFICSLDGQDLAHSLECRANARLIVAAPDLLSALEALATYVDERSGDNECRPIENARAAIEKASRG